RVGRHGQLTRGVRTDDEKTDLTERQDAGISDEHVQRDDDRREDECVRELDRARVRHEAADQTDEREDGNRPEQRKRAMRPRHTRSTGARDRRTNTPSGRTSSMRMTSAKTAESR